MTLAPGELARVEFSLPVDMLNLTGLDGQRQVEPGECDLFIGPSCGHTPLQARFRVSGDAPRRKRPAKSS